MSSTLLLSPTEETLSFWKGITDVGLLGEVVGNITTELLGLLNGVQHAGDQAPMQDAGEWGRPLRPQGLREHLLVM